MKVDALTPAELRLAGYQALADALGPRGMARFLQDFNRGTGNYTRDRRRWLRDASVRSAAHRIRARKSAADR